MESKPRILLADDDKNIRDLLGAMLADAGIEPVLATDGVSALELLARNPDIVLVLLDWMMPRVDGMAVLRELQTWPNPPPVMMLTAKSQHQNVEEALAGGAVGYMIKPVQRDVLISKIDNFLERNRESAQARAARRKRFNLRALAHFRVIDISESGICFESSFPIPKGAIIFLESNDICRRLDVALDRRYSVRVANCAGARNSYRIGAEFIGLTSGIIHEIRKLSRRAGWLA